MIGAAGSPRESSTVLREVEPGVFPVSGEPEERAGDTGRGPECPLHPVRSPSVSTMHQQRIEKLL
jgi:hypothetical protein